MPAARRLAVRVRRFGPLVVLLALFIAGIATATAGGAPDGVHASYWTLRAANPQLTWRRFAEETPPGTCPDEGPRLTHARIDIYGDVAEATFAVAPGCVHVPLQLLSFSAPSAGDSGRNLVDSASGSFDGGSLYHLTVHLPSCEAAGDDRGFQVVLMQGVHVAAAVNGGIHGCP